MGEEGVITPSIICTRQDTLVIRYYLAPLDIGVRKQLITLLSFCLVALGSMFARDEEDYLKIATNTY